MKSAQEWTDTDLNYAIFSQGGDAVYEVVKARDLEMWKQGMTDAAEIVVKYAVDLGRTPVNGVRHLIEDGNGDKDEVRKTYKRAIHIRRDITTSV